MHICAGESTIEMSRFNHTPHWIRSIRKALIHCWNKMSSLNDPAQPRPQMLLSKRWNRKCPIQFHPMYCTQWCHSSFAKTENKNQTWRWISGWFQQNNPVLFSLHQNAWSWRADVKEVKVDKTEGFSPIFKSNAQNVTQRRQAALIRKRIKIQRTRAAWLEKKKGNHCVWLLSCMHALLPEEQPSSIYEEMHSNDMVVVTSKLFPVFCQRPPLSTNSSGMTCK